MSDDKFPVNVVGMVGPGSQPKEEDGAALSFMPMPDEMTTYRMPEVSISITAAAEVNQILNQVQQLLDRYQIDKAEDPIDLTKLDARHRHHIDEILGEGEVSIMVASDVQVRIQESVLAGVWRVQYLTNKGELQKDTIEVADIPSLIREMTFAGDEIRPTAESDGDIPEAVNNAIPLLTEINDKIIAADDVPHVINLTLLPQSDEDLAFLAERLGKGKVTILSRGYGNCRVSSTTTHNTWWVQYFNSQDAIILNTLEVTPVPVVVCASQEDIEDSAQRLNEIRQVYA
jgi:hydrogenase-1 operon protein HyaF